MSTLYVSRGAVEGAAAIFGRCGGAKYTAALRAHFAGSGAHVPRAALWHFFYRGRKCAPRRARRYHTSDWPFPSVFPNKSNKSRCLIMTSVVRLGD
jgi:hypothetical protein